MFGVFHPHLPRHHVFVCLGSYVDVAELFIFYACVLLGQHHLGRYRSVYVKIVVVSVMAGKSLIVLYIIGISVDNAVIAGGVYVLFNCHIVGRDSHASSESGNGILSEFACANRSLVLCVFGHTIYFLDVYVTFLLLVIGNCYDCVQSFPESEFYFSGF